MGQSATSPDYRIIVCGGRDYMDPDRVRDVLSDYLNLDPVIIHGGARGADHEAEAFALNHNLRVQVFPADWDRNGRAAGHIRNEEMAKNGADLCVAFPGGKGTANMVQRAERHGIEVRKVDW